MLVLLLLLDVSVCVQLYDRIEEISNAEQSCSARELGQCSQAVKEVNVKEQSSSRAHVLSGTPLTLTLTLTLIHPTSRWTHWATLQCHSCLLRAAD